MQKISTPHQSECYMININLTETFGKPLLESFPLRSSTKYLLHYRKHPSRSRCRRRKVVSWAIYHLSFSLKVHGRIYTGTVEVMEPSWHTPVLRGSAQCILMAILVEEFLRFHEWFQVSLLRCCGSLQKLSGKNTLSCLIKF